MSSQTNIASFVLRFVQEVPAEADQGSVGSSWRGTIKHVQSDDERHFTNLEEAIAFIADFVNLNRSEPTSAKRPRGSG
jgi:hypothetical protein